MRRGLARLARLLLVPLIALASLGPPLPASAAEWVQNFVPTELWRFVRQIKAPIIYIVGGRSTIVPVATQEELKKALPQAQIVTIPGVGHYPSEENEKDYLTIVDKFLSGQ